MKRSASLADRYLSNAPREARIALERLRRVLKSVAPEAGESISYGILTFNQQGLLVGLGHFKDHLSFFPMSVAVMKTLKSELKAFDTSKGTIRFSASEPLPEALVRRIVIARLRENEARFKKRAALSKRFADGRKRSQSRNR